MGIKFISNLILLLTISCNSKSQEVKLSKVNIDDISINGLEQLGTNPSQEIIISNFGPPMRKVTVPPQIEWDDGGLQLLYDNKTQFYYSRHGDEFYLENITLKSNKFYLLYNKNKISKGDSLGELGEAFIESYEYFIKHNPKPYEKPKQEFYIALEHKTEDGIYYTTNITIWLKNDLIEEIYISFVEE